MKEELTYKDALVSKSTLDRVNLEKDTELIKVGYICRLVFRYRRWELTGYIGRTQCTDAAISDTCRTRRGLRVCALGELCKHS